jgi:pimeloyl-ACP methyl ester carboxylesterase
MKTQFVRSDGARIAYQVFGDGPIDLLFVQGFISHADLQWGDPLFARFLRRMGSFSRVVLYDRRGIGMSDATTVRPSIDQHIADLDRVRTAAGVDRAVVLGFSDGSPIAMLYAATFPHLVRALLLVEAYATWKQRPDLALKTAAKCQPFLDRWGEGLTLDVLAPSLAGSRLNRSNFALFERACMTRETALDLNSREAEIDVFDVLPTISAPTLVLHRRDDVVPIEMGRDVAAAIPGARFVELEGGDHVPFAGDPTAMLDRIEDFVGQIAGVPPPEQEQVAVVFTDIVNSTPQVVELGDRRWRELVASHDDLTLAAAEAEGGFGLESTGDGWRVVFATPPAAVRFAWRTKAAVTRLGLSIRAGVHAGGVHRVGDDIRGLTVNAAARIAARAGAGEVLASSEVVRLCVDAGVQWADAGSLALKGLPGEWSLHRVSAEPEWVRAEPAPANAPVLALTDRTLVSVARLLPPVARTFGRLARPRPVPAAAT